MNRVEAEILALLNDSTANGINQGTDGAVINTFYQGEVKLVPKSYLPALMVWGTRTEQNAHGSAKDQARYFISIRVVIDVVSEFTEANSSAIIEAQYTLRDIMEKRNAAGLAGADSVVGILRRNIRGTSFLFTDNYVIDYAMIPSGGFFYVAADMTIEATSDLILRE